MNIKIVQVVVKDITFYGLGEDSKMYRWDPATAAWLPGWHITQSAPVAEVAPQEPPAPQENPGL